MFARRRPDKWYSSGLVTAFLRETASRVLCFYAPCPQQTRVALCNADGQVVAAYCRSHGRIALREYGLALETRDIA